MASYNPDLEVILYNFKQRSANPYANTTNIPGVGDIMATEQISLRNAIISATVSKTKDSPQGEFSISLKPIKDWTKIIVPGSWVAIYMSTGSISKSQLNNSAVGDGNGNFKSPLKMIGIVTSIRISKKISQNGTATLSYSLTGYDFGYCLTSSIHVNNSVASMIAAGEVVQLYRKLGFPKDSSVWGGPHENINLILNGWSNYAKSPLDLVVVETPSIRMLIPQDVSDLVQGGRDVLQFMHPIMGIDRRKTKDISMPKLNKSADFEYKLLGQKMFMTNQFMLDSTLWALINQYLNPMLNEAYCDLHVVKDPITQQTTVKPLLVVRQIPFNSHLVNNIFLKENSKVGLRTTAYPLTKMVSLPRTKIAAEKILEYDVGFSEHGRINYVEVNGMLAGAIDGSSSTMLFNRPVADNDSVKRAGLRPRTQMGADYGTTIDQKDLAQAWAPLLVDWWFNTHQYATGTIKCIGLDEHIAIGENIELEQEQILGHIESYSHSFSVDGRTGAKQFRTEIQMSRGISSESTEQQYKYLFGEEEFGGDFKIPGASGKLKSQAAGTFGDDIDQRVTFTETDPQNDGNKFSFKGK